MSDYSQFTNGYYHFDANNKHQSKVEKFPADDQYLMPYIRKTVTGIYGKAIKHEARILDYCAEQRLPVVAKFLKYEKSIDGINQNIQTLITQFAGVNLYDWLNKSLFVSELRRSFNCISEYPLFILTMLKGSLQALYHIHHNGIIHCDVRLDHICMPYQGEDVNQGKEFIVFFDKITLVDFANSC